MSERPKTRLYNFSWRRRFLYRWREWRLHREVQA